jgi:hypothetical protein
MISTSTDDNGLSSCGCWLLAAVFNFLIGGWSVVYLLDVFADKVIPFLGACLIGLFVAEISVPVAIVTWLLKAFGVL